MDDVSALDPGKWVDAIIRLSGTGAFWVCVGLVALAIVANAWGRSRRKSD